VTATGALITLVIVLPVFSHEDTKGHEAHEDSSYQVVLRGLRDSSWLRERGFALQNAPTPRTIDKGDRTNIQSPRTVVLRSEDEWQAVWAQHGSARPRPAVDFSKEMVVGVFLGTKPTAAYSVAIVSTIEANGVLQVRYRVTEPRSDAVSAQVITYPYHLAAVPMSKAADVKFEKIQ
jgi:hypothetical protein